MKLAGTIQQPLLVMIRPASATRDFLRSRPKSIKANMVPIIHAPLLSIAFCATPLPPPRGLHFVFTSVSAVQAYARVHQPHGQIAYCVGATTAHYAAAAGFFSCMAQGTAASLVKRINCCHCVYIRGEKIAFNLAKALKKRAICCDSYIAYRQVTQNFSSDIKTKLAHKNVVVPIFSKNSATIFVKQCTKIHFKHLIAIAISRKVSAVLINANIKTFICAHPTRNNMWVEILKIYC